MKIKYHYKTKLIYNLKNKSKGNQITDILKIQLPTSLDVG